MLKEIQIRFYFLLIKMKLKSVLSKTINETKNEKISLEKKKEIFSNIFDKVIRKQVYEMIPLDMEKSTQNRFEKVLDESLVKALRKLK